MKPIRNTNDNFDREKYWNEDYMRYWKARVEEANNSQSSTSSMVAGDVKTSTDDIYLDAISLLEITGSDKVLELGCGFGRSLPVLCKAAAHVSAVDISQAMIDVARAATKENNVEFYVSPSENLSFSSDMFDVIVCFAAFDAMYQAEALAEMNRVCKTGAKVLITGKNDNYNDDDTAALDAEIGARTKNHPNYFTDVEKLMSNIGKFGFGIKVQRFYRRRGDFGKVVPDNQPLKMFYEYLFVLTKVSDCVPDNVVSISSQISRTYERQGTGR